MNAVRVQNYFRSVLLSYIFKKVQKENEMKTAYKFRLYPNKQQEAMLDLTLETCRHLYNLALADRKNAYETEGISRAYEDQAAMLTAEKKEGNFKGVFSQVLQDVLRRLDKSFKAFFRRVKADSLQDRFYPGLQASRGRRQNQDLYYQEG